MKTSNFLSSLLIGVLLAPAFIFSNQQSFEQGISLDQNSAFLYRAKAKCPPPQSHKCNKKCSPVAMVTSTTDQCPLPGCTPIRYENTVTNAGNALTPGCSGTNTPTLNHTGCWRLHWGMNTADGPSLSVPIQLIMKLPPCAFSKCNHTCTQQCPVPCTQACNGFVTLDTTLPNHPSEVIMCLPKGTQLQVIANQEVCITLPPVVQSTCGGPTAGELKRAYLTAELLNK